MLRVLYCKFPRTIDSFLTKRTLQSELEYPKEDTSDDLFVPESKQPNLSAWKESMASHLALQSLLSSPFWRFTQN